VPPSAKRRRRRGAGNGGIEIESASANDSTLAVRDTARGSKSQTIAGIIKALFKAAADVFARRDPDAPKPEAKRRSRGESESGGSPAIRHASKPAARGRYAALWSRPADAVVAFLSEAFALLDPVSDPVAAAESYLSDTLDWMNPFGPPDDFTAAVDADFAPPQDHHFPHL
jgi:hypothetical protein